MRKLFILCALCASLTAFATEGALKGKFTVNADGKQVQFSQGNLQYQTTTGTWRFAGIQSDFIGNASAEWIDLFGWGAADKPTLTTENVNDYAKFVDWGSKVISNGGQKAGVWRTLDWEEWLYLFLYRPNAANLRGHATVNSVHGYIFLPDDWQLPEKLTFTPDPHDWTTNKYKLTQWLKMALAGAVFLPAAGFRTGTEGGYWGAHGFYWSSSLYNDLSSQDARAFYFSEKKIGPRDHERRFYGMSVRLVTDVPGTGQATGQTTGQTVTPTATETKPAQPTSEPKRLFSISANVKVQFAPGNLQYQATTKTWRFAEHQWDILANANAKIAANNAGWIDLFGWGTGKEPTKASADPNDYKAFSEWGANAISNGGNKADAWRTLTRNEWIYVLSERKNATKLVGTGTVNGVKGVILLPDDWVAPTGISFSAAEAKGLLLKGAYYKNANANNFEHNTYSAEQWAKMEAAGAIFLPAAGYRMETNIVRAGDNGNYWTSDISLNNGVDEGEAKNLDFDKGYLGMGMSGRGMGYAVRLVKVIK